MSKDKEMTAEELAKQQASTPDAGGSEAGGAEGTMPPLVESVVPEGVADYREMPMCVSQAAGAALNLRAGPGAQFDVWDQLPAKTEVLQLRLPYGAEVPGWRMIRANGKIGWADARYLALVEG